MSSIKGMAEAIYDKMQQQISSEDFKEALLDKCDKEESKDFFSDKVIQKQKYIFVCDDDGHSFIIPAGKRSDWEDWLYKFYNEELEVYDYPEWVQEIDSPHDVEFYLE